MKDASKSSRDILGSEAAIETGGSSLRITIALVLSRHPEQ
jgi:hypothetical protein